MERYISATVRQISILLGINRQGSLVGSGLAIPGFGIGSLVRSLGLRLGGGSSMAGCHVTVTPRVSTAIAGAAPASVHKRTVRLVPHCWLPARLAWRDSGKTNV